MRIAVASDDQVTISNHFGRCCGFLIFEIENSEIVDKLYRVNKNSRHGRKSDDVRSEENFHKAIVDSLCDCSIIITQGMGERLYNDFKNAAIQPFIVSQNNPENAISLFLENNLENIKDGYCIK